MTKVLSYKEIQKAIAEYIGYSTNEKELQIQFFGKMGKEQFPVCIIKDIDIELLEENK